MYTVWRKKKWSNISYIPPSSERIMFSAITARKKEAELILKNSIQTAFSGYFSVFIQWRVEVIDRISETAFSAIALLYGNGCWLVWEEKCFHINRSSKFVPGGTNKDVEKGIRRKWRYCVWQASQQKNENLMVLTHHWVTSESSESHRIFRLNSLPASLVYQSVFSSFALELKM